MQIIIKWRGLQAPQAGVKVLCMDQIGVGWIKLLKMENGSYVVLHDVPGEYWVTSEGSFEEMRDIYTETLHEELA